MLCANSWRNFQRTGWTCSCGTPMPAGRSTSRTHSRCAIQPVQPHPDRRHSGHTARRPQLDAYLDHLREGDVLTVWKLDRLGRSTRHVLAVVDELKSRGVGFRSITEGLNTEGAMGKAMLTIMAAFAQLERDTM